MRTHQLLGHLCPKLQLVGSHETQNCGSKPSLLVTHYLSVLITLQTSLKQSLGQLPGLTVDIILVATQEDVREGD